MRRALIHILITFYLGVAAQAQVSTAPTTQRPRPATSPTDVLIRYFEALVDADEAAFGQVVVFRDPAAAVRAEFAAMFAVTRLHRVVRERIVPGPRVYSARHDGLVVRELVTREWIDSARAYLSKTEWKIEGNMATTVPSGPGNKPMNLERVGDGWVMIFTDTVSGLDAGQIQQMIDSATRRAEVLNAATEQVKAGKLRTFIEVNDFVDAELNKGLAELEKGPARGPAVVVLDGESNARIAGARVSAVFQVPPGKGKMLTVITDEQGRARLLAQPTYPDRVSVSAIGYAARGGERTVRRGAGDTPDEIQFKLFKPAMVEVTLVLPDERRAAMSIYEGDRDEPAPPELRGQIAPKQRTVTLVLDDPPPPLPDHHPMIRTVLHDGTQGVLHRVTRARTAGGRDVPVFRDAPPPDENTFAMYEVGCNGMHDTVFVIGTLTDARAVQAANGPGNWVSTNERVLGPATRPATRP